MPTTDELRLFFIIHGPYGTGKTTLASTAPGPRLVLDAERGSLFLDKDIRRWRPQEEAVPTDLTDDTNVVVVINSYTDYRMALDLIFSGDHPFETLIVDSITEIQEKLKETITGVQSLDNWSRPDFDVWGKLLDFMGRDIRMFRDVSDADSARPVNVVVVAASSEQSPAKPIMQGAIRGRLPSFCDVEGYLHVASTTDPDTGETKEVRILDVAPHDEAAGETKCRPPQIRERWGAAIPNPSLTRLIKVVNLGNDKENT